jgi:outer membrane protein TolC
VNRAKLKSLELKYEVMLNEELQKLRIEYQKLEREREKADADAQLLTIRREIFAIYQEAYDKKEMKPLEYLQKKLEHESLVQAGALREQDYRIALLELIRLARYGMPDEPIWFEGNHDCLLIANGRR